MQIKSNIYCKILNMPVEVPPETGGGIIGTQKGIITNFIFLMKVLLIAVKHFL